MSKFILFIFAATLSLPAFAGSYSHKCDINLATDDGPGVQQTVLVAWDRKPSGHGGEVHEFKSAPNHELTVSVDSKWITVNWRRAGKNVVWALFVISEETDTQRVAMLYNPENTDELVSVSCRAQSPLKIDPVIQ